MDTLATCMWCAISQIYDTRWIKDQENFWRCQWGHLAPIEVVKELKKAEAKRNEEITNIQE